MIGESLKCGSHKSDYSSKDKERNDSSHIKEDMRDKISPLVWHSDYSVNIVPQHQGQGLPQAPCMLRLQQ